MNTRPEKPGYYWWKPYPVAEWETVRVHSTRAGHLVVHWLNQRGFAFLENEDGIWGDKIDEPE